MASIVRHEFSGPNLAVWKVGLKTMADRMKIPCRKRRHVSGLPSLVHKGGEASIGWGISGDERYTSEAVVAVRRLARGHVLGRGRVCAYSLKDFG